MTEMLTTAQVAARLNVTPRTVQRLIITQDLPARRVGRQYRYPEQELQRWLVRQDARTICTTTNEKAVSTRGPRAKTSGSPSKAQMDAQFAALLAPRTRGKREQS